MPSADDLFAPSAEDDDFLLDDDPQQQQQPSSDRPQPVPTHDPIHTTALASSSPLLPASVTQEPSPTSSPLPPSPSRSPQVPTLSLGSDELAPPLSEDSTDPSSDLASLTIHAPSSDDDAPIISADVTNLFGADGAPEENDDDFLGENASSPSPLPLDEDARPFDGQDDPFSPSTSLETSSLFPSSETSDDFSFLVQQPTSQPQPEEAPTECQAADEQDPERTSAEDDVFGLEQALKSPTFAGSSEGGGGLSESEARRLQGPLASPFERQQARFDNPAPADDFDRLLEETDSKPAPSELAIEPPKRTASTNPYAALISNSGSASPNPYATTASSQANPYAPPAASLNPYMTPSLPSSAVFGSARASPSTSSPYASVSPNPYATSTSPNPYSANFTSPPAPKPAAPPPFVRKTTQTYDAYDPPSMPTIPVRRARGPSPWGGAVSAIASPLGGSNQALPSTTSGMSSPKPPPPPPPKRTDSYAQAPPPPKTFSPPPPPPSTVRAPPPLSSAARAFSPPPPRTVSSPLNSMRAAPPPGRPTPPARAAPPPARALPPPAARAPSPSVFKASSPGPPLDNAQRNVEPRQSLSPSLGSPDVEDRVDEEGRRAEVLDRGSFEVGREVDEEGGDYEGGSFDAGSVEMLILEEEEKPRERTLSEQLMPPPPAPSSARSAPPPPPPRPSSAASNASSTYSRRPIAALTQTKSYAPPPPSQTPPPRPGSGAPILNAYASVSESPQRSGGAATAGDSPSYTIPSLPHQRNTSAASSSYAPSSYAPSSYAPSSFQQPQNTFNSFTPIQPSAYVPEMVLAVADDPLGRGGEKFKRVPVMSFGFDGKVAVCYPSLGMGGGYGAGAVGEGAEEGDGRTVRVRSLTEIIPESALSASSTPFPGPLFLDRKGGAAGEKAKKANILSYLDTRAGEIEQGLGWLKGQSNVTKFRQEEGKGVLVRLLSVMIQNDGRLMGSAKVEQDIRDVLLPDLAPLSSPRASLITPGLLPSTSTFPTSNHSPSGSTSRLPITAFASPQTSTQKSAALDSLTALLLRGEKKRAVQLAMEEKLWAHAMVVSSCIDKQTWGEVVKAFAESELGGEGGVGEEGAAAGKEKRRDALRLTYQMFGGSGSAALAPAAPPSIDPSTPKASLSSWRESLAMIISNRSLGDTQSLNSLGDSLVAQGWANAGHCCYLLSSHPPPLEGLAATLTPRVHLYGSSSTPSVSGPLDVDGIILTETIEYALSLVPVLKGQEQFAGIPYLQPYKLLHALILIENGETAKSQSYCEAIAGSLKASKAPSPYHTLPFLNQLKELSERLSGTSQDASANSWISKVASKPTLDGLGSWFEGRLNKFVAGEGGDDLSAAGIASAASAAASRQPSQAGDKSTAVGPFSHFSAVASTPSSARSSLDRARSSANISSSYSQNYPGPVPPVPQRSGSAMASRPNETSSPIPPPDRSYSALDFTRSQHLPPAPSASYPSSANPSRTSFDRYESYDAASNASTPYGQPNPSDTYVDSSTVSQSNDGPWWGGGAGASATTLAETQTRESYEQPRQQRQPSLWGSTYEGGGETVDLQSPQLSNDPKPASGGGRERDEEEDEDLGFGNSKTPKPAASRTNSGVDDSKSSKEDKEEKPKETKPAASSGWLGRLWGSKKEEAPAAAAGAAAGASGSAPIKAKLGEESAFVYDKDLKRWVNKKAGADTSVPKPPPPPPSRAQSASPANASATGGPARPPPPSGGSSGPPTGPPTRSGSALARPPPSSSTGTPPPPGPPSGTSSPKPASAAFVRLPASDPTADLLARGPPPPGGSTAAGRKKNIRNRYVDVFEPGA